MPPSNGMMNGRKPNRLAVSPGDQGRPISARTTRESGAVKHIKTG